MLNTTLCHIEKNGKYLMLHRVKKKNDVNQDKWVAIGGKFEDKESPEQCNRREVLEETGLHISIFEDFSSTSEYKIAGRVEKRVTIFLASTSDTSTVIQQEEIEDYIWLDFDKALSTLKFENDKSILISAKEYLAEHNI